jgi:hypothetical protein
VNLKSLSAFGLIGTALGMTFSAHLAVGAPTPTPSPAAPASTPVPSPSDCKQMPLNKPQDITGYGDYVLDFYAALAEYEKAMAESRVDHLKKLLHPSIVKEDRAKDEIFNTTIQEFSLEKAKLARTAIYYLNLPASGLPEVKCLGATVRGVTGPHQQFAVIHSHHSNSEQVRLFSIFAPIPDSLVKKTKAKFRVGLVMLHAQIWTHAKKSPEVYFKEAKSKAEKDGMAGWLYAEAARRLYASNPYYAPNELAESQQFVDTHALKKPDLAKIKAALKEKNFDWEFLDFSVAYKEVGIEPAIKLRLIKEESSKEHLEKCEKISGVIAQHLTALKADFKGVECLAYLPGEPLENPPALGSAFFPWTKLGL